MFLPTTTALPAAASSPMPGPAAGAARVLLTPFRPRRHVPTLHAWRQADPEGLGGRLGGVFPEDPGLAMAGPAGQRVWMALQGGATPTATGPLGAALLEADDDPHQAWVFIAIAPDRRGCGWGRLLLGAVAEAARRQGLARLLAAGGAEWAAPAALRCAYASGFTAAGGAVLRLALT